MRLGKTVTWSRRVESNHDLSLRRAEFYPLKYDEMGLRKHRSHRLSTIGHHCGNRCMACPSNSRVQQRIDHCPIPLETQSRKVHVKSVLAGRHQFESTGV